MTAIVKTLDEATGSAYLLVIGGPCPACFITNPHRHRIEESGEFGSEAEPIT